MLRFLLWPWLQFPLVLAIIYLVTFFLVWVAPGSPFDRTDPKDRAGCRGVAEEGDARRVGRCFFDTTLVE